MHSQSWLQISAWDHDADTEFKGTTKTIEVRQPGRNGDVRIVLGPDTKLSPDVLITRNEEGDWVLLVHPHDGDPLCAITIKPGKLAKVDDLRTGEGTVIEEQLAAPRRPHTLSAKG